MDAFRPNVAARERWLAVADGTLPQPASRRAAVPYARANALLPFDGPVGRALDDFAAAVGVSLTVGLWYERRFRSIADSHSDALRTAFR
jgi:hypothetical protein